VGNLSTEFGELVDGIWKSLLWKTVVTVH